MRIHHGMRSTAFAVTLLVCALHVWDRHAGPGIWLLMTLAFLVYPQVQYRRACRAAKPTAIVLGSLSMDSAVLGFVMGALHFPLWTTVAVLLATMANSASNKEWWGVGKSALAAAAGMLAAVGVFGAGWAPATDWPVTIASIVGLAAYILALGHLGYRRNVQLRLTRAQLQARETELIAANAVLESHLQEIQALHEQLREQANRDALTGLHNRRYLDSTLERETARCEREGEALSLILLDVDHFKSYNDHYGHQAGDAALQRVADALTASVKRASDLVARYGGEEFVVVLPDVDAPAAMTLADTMRRAVETLNIPHVRSPYGRVTISLGVAIKEPGRREPVERLIRVADGALYRAKQSGRNQVQEGLACFDDPTVAGGLARLVWTATYECDQPLIDDQHRSLFAQINRLLGAINTGESRETLTVLVRGLLEAVATHFRDEEAVFTGAGYPGSEAHVASHRDLLERATRIADGFHRDEESIGEMFRFLAQDLVARHFLAADREFFPYLHATAKAASA